MTITRIEPGKRFSAAVRHNNTLYIAGQVADTRPHSIEVQTKEVLAKIDALLSKPASTRPSFSSINVYLAQHRGFQCMNAAFDAWVDTGEPANPRHCRGPACRSQPASVEMTAIAALD